MRLLSLILVAACAPGGDDATPPATEFDRLPDAAFPFALWSDTSTYGDAAGIYIGQGLYFQTPGNPVWEKTALPVAVAALPDRLAVVFAPADHPGLDLAFGGVDLPWTRQPLTDLPRTELGALDAIAGTDGTVWIAVRERHMPTVHLYHWHDGTIDHEIVPRPSGHRHASWRDRCPDVVMGMSRAGDLDVLMMQEDAAHRLISMHRHAGAWSVDEIATSDNATPPTGFFAEYGCKSRIAYDEDDTPMVLTTTRLIPQNTPETVGGQLLPGSPLPSGVFSPAPTINFAGYYVGGDGRWRPSDASTDGGRSTGPFAYLDQWSNGSGGNFDLDVRPDGLLVAGPLVHLISIDADNGAELWLPISGLAHPVPDHLRYDQVYPVHAVHFDNAAAFVSEVDKITFDRCGNMQAYGVDRLDVDLEQPLMQKGFHACLTPHRAPVHAHTPDVYGFAPVWAHGPRAYDVQLCLANQNDTTLTVCVGGWNPDATETFVPDASLPHVVSASANGDVVLDRDLAAGEFVEVRAMAMASAEDVPTEIVGPHPAAIHADLPTLAPGAAYRLLVTARTDNASTADLANVRVDYDFRVPDPSYIDPRYTVDPVPGCTGTRDTSGACVLAYHPSPAAGNGVGLFLDVDPRFPTTPVVTDLAGNVIPTNALVEWSVDLQPNTPYIATYPPGTVDHYGAAFTEGERTAKFTTGSM